MEESKNKQKNQKKKQKNNKKKQMEPSPWMGPPENMSGIQKLQFSLTKKQKNKIKTNPLACFLGGPIQGLGSICFFCCFLTLFCLFFVFPFGLVLDLFFWFDFFAF